MKYIPLLHRQCKALATSTSLWEGSFINRQNDELGMRLVPAAHGAQWSHLHACIIMVRALPALADSDKYAYSIHSCAQQYVQAVVM
eukprot:16367-Heterococcus_DN1.PRE.7